MAASSRITPQSSKISKWLLELNNEFALLKWSPQSPDWNPTEHLGDVVKREIHIMDLEKLCEAVDQNLRGIFSHHLGSLHHEELRQF